MLIITVNTGSSSIRLTAFDTAAGGLKQTAVFHQMTNQAVPEDILAGFVKENRLSPGAFAHRVVHGGEKFRQPAFITDETAREIESLSLLAPLHNPVAMKWINACRSFNLPQIAIFDTAFYAALPGAAKTCALPKDVCARYGIRRYGFHGIAHKAMLQRWQALRPDLETGGKIISLQLGSGCSATAVKNGQPVDTSMGFSPLEGLVMSSRSGDIDPGVLLFLQKSGMDIDKIDHMLHKQSGLLGISGISADMKKLLESREDSARLAIDVYCRRVKKYIGAYMAVLNGADGIIFGGGVGEHAAVIREKITADMQWCGIELDSRANDMAAGIESRISAPSAKVDIRVIPVNEAVMMAEEAVILLEARE